MNVKKDSSGKSFFKTTAGKFVLAVVVAVLIILSFFGYQLYSLSHPEKSANQNDPGKFLLHFEEIDFKSADGILLSGWFIPGVKKGPVLILCHKLGSSKSSLLNIAIPLQMDGYNIFLFDFRNSGDSKGTASSFGILEARDILGAVDYLITRNDIDANRIGILGVEMGAYAAVLAACERKNIRAIAMDSLYPDLKYYFTRKLFGDSEFGGKYLSPIPLFLYSIYFGTEPSAQKASSKLRTLQDRDLLFIVGMGDRKMMNSTRAIYGSLRETIDSEKNLIELPSSESAELYGEDKKNYDEKVLSFFQTYLPIKK
ncbi:MAG: hypothetical protein AB1756_07395 [Acidobacteriota bacterium]